MISIEGYEFEGWYSSTDELKNQSGVYVIVCIEERFTIIDVGEAEKVKERIDTHDRKDCWERNCKSGTIKFGVHYTPNMTDEERREIEGKIRNSPKRTVPCGKV